MDHHMLRRMPREGEGEGRATLPRAQPKGNFVKSRKFQLQLPDRIDYACEAAVRAALTARVACVGLYLRPRAGCARDAPAPVGVGPNSWGKRSSSGDQQPEGIVGRPGSSVGGSTSRVVHALQQVQQPVQM
ncbi:hypothetical protein MSG28_010964 [Choristoneura fumiferana]|uniref:Uncharacterized protein n=1 Tax=Choristoneura fumiferana TaxID=7141 RepID=A0ACC0KPK0_CHOFU|nr:hypothetical protein MSG28_010964 [Choristoneura fumiferana]